MTTLGVIVGNRGFFPSELCEGGRKTILEVLEKQGFKVIALTPEDTAYGSVETYQDAKKCADLFKKTPKISREFLFPCPTSVTREL